MRNDIGINTIILQIQLYTPLQCVIKRFRNKLSLAIKINIKLLKEKYIFNYKWTIFKDYHEVNYNH
jgi:hypothetical protein